MTQREGEGFRSLRVWVDAVVLAKNIYKATLSLPREEQFGLTPQMRRAAVSVPSNIAEGSVWRSRKQFAHFIETALGSLAELETQIEIAMDIYAPVAFAGLQEEITRVRKMLYGLRTAILKAR